MHAKKLGSEPSQSTNSFYGPWCKLLFNRIFGLHTTKYYRYDKSLQYLELVPLIEKDAIVIEEQSQPRYLLA